MRSIFVINNNEFVTEAMVITFNTKSAYFRIVGSTTIKTFDIQKILSINPEIILFDMSLPEQTGIEIIIKLRSIIHYSRIILINSINNTSSFINSAIIAGANGIISNSCCFKDMEKSILRIISGEQFLGIGCIDLIKNISKTNESTIVKLTPQEIKIIYLRSIGKTNKETSAILNISIETVKTHCKKIHKKFNAKKMYLCILRAKELKIIP